jgi:UDP-3-O-[3-hydroxymyristoyl] N-acetylglucosamine deacetylase
MCRIVFYRPGMTFKKERSGMYCRQRTLAGTIRCSGIGVHSGRNVNLKIKQAPINHGIKFIRTDLQDSPCISARFNRVVDTSLATVIGVDGFIVSTIEHLMASFAGLSIDNALVEVDAHEMPIMDGSAAPFARLIRQAGIVEQDGPKCVFLIKKPISLEKDGKSVSILPYPVYKITCSIEYDHPLIQKQIFSTEITDHIFEKDICSARTFGFLHEIEQLKRFGLAKGGSLDNAVVVDKDCVLNTDGLRFPDEFVRHKLLDCIGDFSLLGLPLVGHIVTHKSGHAFHHAFLEKFFSEKSSWETYMIPDNCNKNGFDAVCC